MSRDTSIQWCDSTVNPVMGCAGCELWTPDRRTCYAGNLHLRRKNHVGFSPDFSTPKLFPGRMAEAAKWPVLTGHCRKDKPWMDLLPRLIFVSDMGDALSEVGAIDSNNRPFPDGKIPFEYLDEEIIAAALSDVGSLHRWLWLTKRPARMAQFTRWMRKRGQAFWPQNLWAGTSITSSATLRRVDQLKLVGDENTTRFLSVEPLWEPISLARRLMGIHWVIVGGESGSAARPFDLDWARQLRDECRDAGVAFFLKQLGGNPVLGGSPAKFGHGQHRGDWRDWPPDLCIREFPSA